VPEGARPRGASTATAIVSVMSGDETAPAARRWELWREDDNANRYLVSVHDDEESANARLAQFESGVVHKQRYWVQRASVG
jgi:hypothetical protein